MGESYTATLRCVSDATAITIPVTAESSVSGALHLVPGSRLAVALAPGAGTSMANPLLVALASGLSARGFTVLRFNFSYSERGSRRPDPPQRLIAAYRAAAEVLRGCGAGKLVMGGRSMGGRMASMLAAEGYACDALVYFGYPLHPAGQPAKLRDAHLPQVRPPMLFVQGTRDELCDLALLRPVLERIGERAALHILQGADHSFAARKTDRPAGAGSVLDEAIGAAADWLDRVARD